MSVARVGALLFALFLALPAWAAEAHLQMPVKSLQAGQSTRLTLFIVEGQSRGAPSLTMPDGLQVAFTNSSRSFQTVNFKRTIVMSYGYRVTALRSGDYEIPAQTLSLLDGTEVTSNPLELQVRDRESEGELTDVEVTAGFHTASAWEGQVVVYSYKLTSRVQTMGVDWSLPPFEGLRYPQHGQPIEGTVFIEEDDTQITVFDGHHPLIATATGERSLPAAVAQVRLPSGRPNIFGVRPYKAEVFAAKPSPLTVRPLPQPAPDNFSALVGSFQFRSRVDKRTAAVGESVNWTVDVAGDGAIEGFVPPGYENEPRFSVYENTTDIRAAVDDGLYVANASFKRVIVPTQEGELVFPPLEVVFFSPDDGKYITRQITVPTLQVTAGREGANGGDVESFAVDGPALPTEDAVTIDFRDNYRWGLSSVPPVHRLLPAFGVFAAFPAFFIVLAVGVERVREWGRRRAEARKRPPAPGDLLVGLPDDPQDRLAALDGALRLALAQHAGVEPSQLDRTAVVEGLAPALREEVQGVSRSLDRARFAGEVGPDLTDAVARAVKALGDAR